MGKTAIKKYINTYIRRLKKDFRPTRIILYGSFLTSRFKEGSDVDLLVISDQFSQMDEDERLRILYRKTVGLPLDFHLYGFTPKEIEDVSSLSTLSEALRKGITIIPK